MKKSEILYNFDTAFLQSDYLVIVEGIFDVLKDSIHAVGLFGKSPSDCQIRLLMLGTFKKVLCFLDTDALPESTSLAKRLSSYYNTYIVKTPFKDLGEIPYNKVQDILTNDKYLERVF